MNMRLQKPDKVCWLTAAPLWNRSIESAEAPSSRFREPELLRFRGDDFMDRLAGTLSGDPAALSGHVARAETWREERAGWQSAAPAEPVMLYQPVHNRYYLAAASLVCQRAGLPDRRVDVALGDRVFIVLRRLVPRPGVAFDPSDPARRAEEGWLGDAQSGRWVALTAPDLPGDAEERLPMFPLPFAEAGQPRRLHAALVPVARANVYSTTAGGSRASAAEAVDDPLGDPRIAALAEGPLGGLELLAGLTTAPAPPSSVAADQRFQSRSSLVLALLDLAENLEREIPALVSALRSGSASELTEPEGLLRARLAEVPVPSGFTVGQAIVRALDMRDRLADGRIDDALISSVLGHLPSLTEIGTVASALLGGAPGLKSLIKNALSDERVAAVRDLADGAVARIEAAASGDETVAVLLLELLALDDLMKRELPEVAAAIPGGSTALAADALILSRFETVLAAGMTWGEAVADARTKAPAIYAGSADGTRLARLAPAAAELRAAAVRFFTGLEEAAAPAVAARPLPASPPTAADDVDAEPVYVLRAVYERPHCTGIHPPVVSAPSRPFRLAGFFDPDAPVRELKIEMPARTSIADFRRAPKGVAIRLSRELRRQISRVRDAKLSDPLDEQLGGGSFDLGVICSLSIPIITICALILLLIIVQLLNIVFWWMPYFMICFPVKR